MRSIPVSYDELGGEALRHGANARHMRRAEMCWKQGGAVLHALLDQLPARCPRNVRKFAEFRIPMRCMDLQRMMHHVAGEQCTAVGIGEPQRDMTARVPGRRHDRQAIIDRVLAVDQNRLAGLDYWQDAVAICEAAVELRLRSGIPARIADLVLGSRTKVFGVRNVGSPTS